MLASLRLSDPIWLMRLEVNYFQPLFTSLNVHKLFYSHTNLHVCVRRPAVLTACFYEPVKALKKTSDIYWWLLTKWIRAYWRGLRKDETLSWQAARGPVRLLLRMWMDHLKLVKLHGGRLARSQVQLRCEEVIDAKLRVSLIPKQQYEGISVEGSWRWAGVSPSVCWAVCVWSANEMREEISCWIWENFQSLLLIKSFCAVAMLRNKVFG